MALGPCRTIVLCRPTRLIRLLQHCRIQIFHPLGVVPRHIAAVPDPEDVPVEALWVRIGCWGISVLSCGVSEKTHLVLYLQIPANVVFEYQRGLQPTLNDMFKQI